MSDQVTISILMPSYNPGRYLADAVESVLPQLRAGDELVVQDAGSNDGTVEYLSSIEDDRLRWVSEPDSGQADALNKALARARGDWICWINADDTIGDETIDAYRRSMGGGGKPVEIVYGGFSLIDGDGHKFSSTMPKQVSYNHLLFGTRSPFSGSFAIRSDFLRRIGGFNGAFEYCMDYELYLRAWRDLQGASRRIPEDLASLRIHDGTKTTSQPWGFVREARRARRRSLSGRHRVLLVLSEVSTVVHVILILTTPLRYTAAYRRFRSLLGRR